MHTAAGISNPGHGACARAVVPDTHLGVLFHQLGEVVEEAVLRTQEVELVVPLLLLHELREELAAVTGHELRRQLHHVQVEGRDGGRVGHELKLGRRLFGNDGLVDDLRLDLGETQHKSES